MSHTEDSQTNQYLTFTLDREVFALRIDSVREVLELSDITRIPRTPEFMRGVINLRGHAVPVVDLRRKFRMQIAEDTVNTCIIIVEVNFEGEGTVMGALADSVREVIELDGGEIEAAPKMGAAVRTEFIKGMGKQNEQFIIILDVDKVFSAEELALIQSGAGEADDDTASRSAA